LIDSVNINPAEEFELLPNKSKLVRFIVKAPGTFTDAEYPFQLYFGPPLYWSPRKTQPAGRR